MSLPDYPISREETYLSNIAGENTALPAYPISRKEQYLEYIAQHGGGGSTEIIADEYDATATYSVGDFCTHSSKLYCCNTDISVAEEWTAAHWTETVVGDELSELKSSKVNEGVVADAYDATATYAVGAYCIHDNTLYKCSTAISTAEPWTAEHWTEKTISDEFGVKIKLNGTEKTPNVDGYVNIPKADYNSLGVISVDSNDFYACFSTSSNGKLNLLTYSPGQIYSYPRYYMVTRAVTGYNIDAFVKVAMCQTGTGSGDDAGKPLIWTDTEKLGAWNRLNSIKTSMGAVAVSNAQYYLGEQADVSVTLPATASAGHRISVVFYSGATAATLTISGSTIGTIPTPAANERVEVNMLYDGTYWAIQSNTIAVV